MFGKLNRQQRIMRFAVIAVVLIFVSSLLIVGEEPGPAAPTLNLTRADSGQTYTVALSTKIVIEVGNLRQYSSVSPSPLTTVSISNTQSVFRAAHDGTAIIESFILPQCPVCAASISNPSQAPTAAALPFQTDFTVTINVGKASTHVILPPSISSAHLTVSASDNEKTLYVVPGEILYITPGTSTGPRLSNVVSSDSAVLRKLPPLVYATPQLPATSPSISSTSPSSSSEPGSAGGVMIPALSPGATPSTVIPITGEEERFEALAEGTATLSGTISPYCPPGVACPAYVELFKVTIVVSARKDPIVLPQQTPLATPRVPLPIYNGSTVSGSSASSK